MADKNLTRRRRAWKYMTPAAYAAIRADYEAGMKWRELEKKYGYSPATIHRAISGAYEFGEGE